MTTIEREQPAYRWVIVAVCSLINAIILGQIVNGLSVYFVPLEVAFGWDRADIALINTIGLVGLALGSIVMGRLADRVPIRTVALCGVIAMGLSTLAASRASELWQLYVCFFVAGAFGGGAVAAPLMALIGNWFVRGAGLAIGLASAGQALGQGGVPFSGAFLIEAMGWRGALATQALGTLILLLPLAFFLRDPPKTGGAAAAAASEESPTGLSNRVITIWLSIAVIFCCMCMSVPLMHLVPYIQGCGFPAPEAGSVLFFMLMIAIAGRVAFGKVADMIGALPAYLLASGWQTALVFGFTFITDLGALYVYAAIYGFGYAGVMTTLLVTARNLTAPARRASSMGFIVALAYVGHGIGGWQGGLFYDITGAYSWTFGNAAIAGMINLAIVGALWITINNRRGGAAQPA